MLHRSGQTITKSRDPEAQRLSLRSLSIRKGSQISLDNRSNVDASKRYFISLNLSLLREVGCKTNIL